MQVDAPWGARTMRAVRQSAALRTLRYRDFRIFWLGFGAAVAGFQIQRVGLGFLAYDLTGSAFLLALVFSGDSIPMVLLSPLGGVISDRIDRRTILIVSRAIVAVLGIAIAVLSATGTVEVWHLLVFSLLSGVCYAIDVPARQAMVHDLVPREDLVHAIALTATLRQTTRIAGPAIGGLTLLLAGAQGTFFLMAVAQVVLVLSIVAIRLPPLVRTARESVTTDLMVGVRFILGHRVIRALLVVTMIPALSAMAYQALTPVFARDVLGQGGDAIGIMLSAAGVGALLGSLLVTAHSGRLTSPFASLILTVAFSLAVALFALSRSYPLSLALLALVGLGNTIASVGITSAVQRRTPAELQGRVMGVYTMMFELIVGGSLLVGAAVDLIGPRIALASAGMVSAVLVALAALLLPRAVREQPALS